MANYTLENDGDDLEKTNNDRFLKNEFPSYEKFWQNFVIPLTERPHGIHMKDDTALAKIGKGHKEVAIAQLHYTVFVYIAKVYELKQINPLNPDQFSEALTKICSALDVADELLERYTSSTVYDPWNWRDSKRARNRWRSGGNRLNYIRLYRNKMIHGAIVPAIIIHGTYSRYRIPKFGKEQNYIDWRKVTNFSVGAGGQVRNDFDAPNNLLDKAWDDAVAYLESSWASDLL